MTLLAWMIGLVLPACGAEGIAGLPMPAPIDLATLERPSTPNTFLAGPAGSQPAPDVVLQPFAMPAAALYEAARVTFGQRERTFVAAEFPGRMQLHYVVRSALINYPDLVTVQIHALDGTHSTMTVWSRSVYGHRDFGVNRERTEAWLAALPRPESK